MLDHTLKITTRHDFETLAKCLAEYVYLVEENGDVWHQGTGLLNPEVAKLVLPFVDPYIRRPK